MRRVAGDRDRSAAAGRRTPRSCPVSSACHASSGTGHGDVGHPDRRSGDRLLRRRGGRQRLSRHPAVHRRTHRRSRAAGDDAAPRSCSSSAIRAGPSRSRPSRTTASAWPGSSSSSPMTSGSTRWRWRAIRRSPTLRRSRRSRRGSATKLPDEFFVRRLAEGVGRIAAAFFPKPVIVRTSDFKTNEYASLAGRPRVRADRSESDDRLPRRVALLRPALRTRASPSSAGRCGGCARRWVCAT